MKTAVSPRIITADPSTGFETNVTSRVAPVIIRNVIENSEEGKKSDMKLVDQLGRTLAGNRIQFLLEIKKEDISLKNLSVQISLILRLHLREVKLRRLKIL